MPKDVVLGEGRTGAALLNAFPGQYRSADGDEIQTFDRSNYMATFPGASAGQPNYADPDNPREMVTTNVPGVGLVVVPKGSNIASVLPVEHTMAGQVFPDATIEMNGMGESAPLELWHRHLTNGLNNNAHETDPKKQLGLAFQHVTRQALDEVKKLRKKGRVRGTPEAVHYVQRAILTSARRYNPMVQAAARASAAAVGSYGTKMEKALGGDGFFSLARDSKNIFPIQNRVVETMEMEREQMPGMRDQGNMADWRGSMFGFGLFESLFGKPQSWYDRIDRDQKATTVLIAEINGIGGSTWDYAVEIASDAANPPAGLTANMVFDTVTADLIGVQKMLLVTANHVPADQDIADGEQKIARYRAMCDYIKSTDPAVQQASDTGSAEVKSMVAQMGTLKSPAAAGTAEFQKQIEDRAAALGESAFSFMKILPWAAGAIGALFVANKVGVI